MFDIGFWELILIFALGLMILGPERLPRVARTAGQWVAQARRLATNLQRELEREITLEEDRSKKDAPDNQVAGPDVGTDKND